MAVGTWELAFILILLLLIPVFIFFIYRANKFKKTLSGRSVTRGLSGVAGATVNLSCPSGQKISVYKANYICTNPQVTAGGTSHESSTCDPFFQPDVGQSTSFYNPDTTLDLVNGPTTVNPQYNVVAKCNGSRTCSFVVPSVDPSMSGTMCNIPGQTPSSCTSNGGTIQLVGTYDCVPA